MLTTVHFIPAFPEFSISFWKRKKPRCYENNTQWIIHWHNSDLPSPPPRTNYFIVKVHRLSVNSCHIHATRHHRLGCGWHGQRLIPIAIWPEATLFHFTERDWRSPFGGMCYKWRHKWRLLSSPSRTLSSQNGKNEFQKGLIFAFSCFLKQKYIKLLIRKRKKRLTCTQRAYRFWFTSQKRRGEN